MSLLDQTPLERKQMLEREKAIADYVKSLLDNSGCFRECGATCKARCEKHNGLNKQTGGGGA